MMVAYKLLVGLLALPSTHSLNLSAPSAEDAKEAKETVSSYLPQARILGGVKVEDPNRYNFIVSLQKYDEHKCGGTLLNSLYIVTAGHCADSEDGWKVKYNMLELKDKGEKNQLVEVEKVFRHEKYNPDTDENDIAVWKLKAPGIKGYSSKIKLSEKVDSLYDQKVSIIGWGATAENPTAIASPHLNFLSIKLFQPAQCSKLYEKMKGRKYDEKSQLCAGELEGGKDACQGDSGGPLFVERDSKYELVGITSYGIGCGRKNLPGVYTNVQEYKGFVQGIIKPEPEQSLSSSPSESATSSAAPTTIPPASTPAPAPTTQSPTTTIAAQPTNTPRPNPTIKSRPQAIVTSFSFNGQPKSHPTFLPPQFQNPQFQILDIQKAQPIEMQNQQQFQTFDGFRPQQPQSFGGPQPEHYYYYYK